MDIAVRWSHSSNAKDPQFLIADVTGHTFKHCRATGIQGKALQWREISRNSNAPPFRAFDWSHKHGIVAVGQWSGETSVLGLSNSSASLSIPVKSQRQCNAVSFNSGTLLGTGLEKVRNDFCLNIYDINHTIAKQSGDAPAAKYSIEPLRKLASSEGIMSIKFFPDEPNLLVTGVKGTCIRIYDIRENTGNPALQFQTSCVHNIAIDPCDQNYFASAASTRDSLVNVWDRRTAVRPSQAKQSSYRQEVPSLELKDVFGGPRESDSASVWSLRYSVAESGCLGILGSGGNFRIIRTKKEFIPEEELLQIPKEQRGLYVEDLYVHRTETIGKPSSNSARANTRTSTSQAVPDQIRAFDFMNLASNGQYQVVLLRGNQDIEVRRLPNSIIELGTSQNNKIMFTAGISTSKPGSSPIPGLSVIKPPIKGNIAQNITELNKRLASLNVNKTELDQQDIKDINDGWNDGTVSDSENVSSPITVASPGMVVTKGTIQDACLLADKFRRRSLEGYLFDVSKNIRIVREDDNLVEMWNWIDDAVENASDDKMISEQADFSYLGLFDIWNNRLGHNPETRVRPGAANVSVPEAIQKLADSLVIPDLEMADNTKKLDHRKVALYSLGFRPKPLETVKRMTLSGRGTEAALHALILDDYPAAITATRSGPRQFQKRQIGSAVQLHAQGESVEQVRKLVDEVFVDETDIFAKAIIAILCDKYFDECIASPSLPPRYQAALAIKLHPDADLSEFIASRTQTAIREGDISNILYTGLSDDAVNLFASYVERTSDMQSAVLALSYTTPRFFQHPRATYWRSCFRKQLNALKHWIQRASFDQQSMRLARTWDGKSAIELAPRRFRLCCSNCDKPIDRDFASANGQETAQPNTPQASRVLGSDGTMCPRCKARLPRCAICDKWVGVEEYRAHRLPMTEEMNDSFEDHMEFCFTCQHVYHRGCATGWFEAEGKVVCPMVGCNCSCMSLDGPPRQNDSVTEVF